MIIFDFLIELIYSMVRTFFLLTIIIVNTCYSQIEDVQLQKSMGGSGDEITDYNCMTQTLDGGYIIAGHTYSNDGDVSGNHSEPLTDMWIVKLDTICNIEWQKCLGGTNDDYAYSVQQTIDNGYIVAGRTLSTDGDVFGFHGSLGSDYWIVKLNDNGNIEWQKCLGGFGAAGEVAKSIQQTMDEGYIVAGYTWANDGDVSGNHGKMDYWIVKLDNNGNLEWQKCLGGSDFEFAEKIVQTSDEGFLIAGSTWSNDGDVTGFHGGLTDSWIVKLDSVGNLEWQKCFGGSDDDSAHDILQTIEGGYIFTGTTKSNDGDVTGNHGKMDIWVVKLDIYSNVEWQKCFGGSEYDSGNSIDQTQDGGYLIGGFTNSNDGDIFDNHGGYDYWVIKISNNGSLEWQKCLGGTNNDYGKNVKQTTDGAFVMTGNSHSNDGDVSGNNGGNDYWIVKFDLLTSINNVDVNNFDAYPNPFKEQIIVTKESINDEIIIELLDVHGRIVKSVLFRKYDDLIKIQTHDLTPGPYLLRFGSTTAMIMVKY